MADPVLSQDHQHDPRKNRRRRSGLLGSIAAALLAAAGASPTMAAGGSVEEAYAKFGGASFTLTPVETPGAGDVGASSWLDDIVGGTSPNAGLADLPPSVQVAGPAIAPLAAISMPNISGLRFRSGTACYRTAFEDWRNRDVDVITIFGNRDTWSSLVSYAGGSYVRGFARRQSIVSIGMGLLAKTSKGDFAGCRNGKYDNHFADYGRALVRNGAGDAILRLGWEPNGPHNPWFMGRTDPSAYKACFQRAVTKIKSTAPNVTIQWTPRRGSNEIRYPIEQGYPGDGYVDQIGLQYYDYYPVSLNQSQWNSGYMLRERNGGLKGIGTYLGFAKQHGKKLALAEWGVADGYKDSGATDNPFFIEKIYEFMKNNSGNVAYESYFNCANADPDLFMIFPESNNPRAAGRYRSLWRNGS